MSLDALSSQNFLDAALASRAQTPALDAVSDPARAAEEFESYYISQVIAALSEGLETDAPFGGGAGERAFRSFLNDEYAAAISRAGGIGVADALRAEIEAMQAQERG